MNSRAVLQTISNRNHSDTLSLYHRSLSPHRPILNIECTPGSAWLHVLIMLPLCIDNPFHESLQLMTKWRIVVKRSNHIGVKSLFFPLSNPAVNLISWCKVKGHAGNTVKSKESFDKPNLQSLYELLAYPANT